MASMRALCMALAAAWVVSLVACGGGGGSGASGSSSSGGATTDNVASVIIDGGPPAVNSINTLFVAVTVCVPGSTTECQTIDHIQVDTGSYGLRLLAPVLTLTLPVETLANGKSVAECTTFVDGFSWGPIVKADIQIAGEKASAVPIQSIGDSRYSSVPSDCSSSGQSEDTVAAFGANGILGIGPFELDEPACATAAIAACYYACATPTSCANSAVPTAMLVPNPVTRFATDNNGVIIQLPSVPAQGAANVTGTLTFGIDTQTNNVSGSQTVLNVDLMAFLAITYKGQTLANSFIDSGSNGIYFDDTSITNCVAPPTDPTSRIVEFYCPTSPLSETLSIEGMNGGMANNVPFVVGNAQTIGNTVDAFGELAGSNPNPGSFDFGLAFFYGRRVAVAVQGETTTVGTGPYIAF